MAALLVSLAIMSILASVAMPVWRHAAQREKEAELVFRAGQVAHAIEVMRRKIPNASPPDLDYLVKQKFLRKKYKDPMTKDGEWRIVTPQELQGATMGPGAARPGMLSGGSGTSAGGTGLGRTGLGGTSSGGTSPGGTSPGGTSTGPGGTSALPGSPGGSTGTSSFGTSSRGTVNTGPVAAVASKSTQKSIRVFKGRDRYDQWIVTIEDVMPRSFLQPQQPNQQRQPGRTGPGSSTPGSSRPGFGSPSPGSQTPSPSGLPSRP